VGARGAGGRRDGDRRGQGARAAGLSEGIRVWSGLNADAGPRPAVDRAYETIRMPAHATGPQSRSRTMRATSPSPLARRKSSACCASCGRTAPAPSARRARPSSNRPAVDRPRAEAAAEQWRGEADARDGARLVARGARMGPRAFARGERCAVGGRRLPHPMRRPPPTTPSSSRIRGSPRASRPERRDEPSTRGSRRNGSNAGSTFSITVVDAPMLAACSSRVSARSCSPRPTWTRASSSGDTYSPPAPAGDLTAGARHIRPGRPDEDGAQDMRVARSRSIAAAATDSARSVAWRAWSPRSPRDFRPRCWRSSAASFSTAR
jgi:hypothetical protein